MNAWSMTHWMLVRLQLGWNVGYFIRLWGLSQIEMLRRLLNTHTFSCLISVNSPNYFHLLPKRTLSFNSPRFRHHLNWNCSMTTSVSEIVGNTRLLWAKPGQPWLACLSRWAFHGPCPGHHATGLLLEIWTLGNVGMNSRSLNDYSACPISSKRTKPQ